MSPVNDYQATAISTTMLRKMGATYRQISRANAAGYLRRIRQGWYELNEPIVNICEPFNMPSEIANAFVSGNPMMELDTDNVRRVRYDRRRRKLIKAAVKAGGVCGCLSAAFVYGFWEGTVKGCCAVIGDGILAKMPARSHVKNGEMVAHVHHVQEKQQKLCIESPLQALKHIIQFHDPLVGLCCIENARYKGFITDDQAEELRTNVSKRKWLAAYQYYEIGAQACGETWVRVNFRKRRFKVRLQSTLKGYSLRFDIEIEPGVVLEIDSQEFHGGELQVHKDRVRDQILRENGKICIRLSWQQIWLEWEQTRVFLFAEVRRAQRLLRLKSYQRKKAEMYRPR